MLSVSYQFFIASGVLLSTADEIHDSSIHSSVRVYANNVSLLMLFNLFLRFV